MQGRVAIKDSSSLWTAVEISERVGGDRENGQIGGSTHCLREYDALCSRDGSEQPTEM
jgi:hypothetical protein